MADQITNYQCPACTGPLHYAGDSGKLECEFCGSSFTVEEIEKLYAEKNENAVEAAVEAEEQAAQQAAEQPEAGPEEWGEDGEKMKAYNCPSCGAELLCDETTAATACPYCGNPTVVPGQFRGARKPKYVIPFKLDKEAAVAALKKHYKGKLLLPGAFAKENHLKEVKGIYVPFWLFDGHADGDVTFEATKVHTRTTATEYITETDHYTVHRAGTVQFQRLPVDGSTKMPDAHMDAIEPFDYEDLKPFSMAYLPGYLADQYDVTPEDCGPRVDRRCQNSTLSALESTVTGYDSCVATSKTLNVYQEPPEYAMLPVWLLTTKWKGKSFLFAMNGQTGRLIGDLPVSWKKFWLWFAGVFAGSAGLLALIFL